MSRPRNLWVPIGTPLSLLLQEAGGLREEDALMLLGGPMMGSAVQSLDAPVAKDTNSLICMARWERKSGLYEQDCIRCGRCVDVCPMRLAPVFLAQAVRGGDLPRLARLHPEDCISCGCCSFICPSGLPLVELAARAQSVLSERREA